MKIFPRKRWNAEWSFPFPTEDAINIFNRLMWCFFPNLLPTSFLFCALMLCGCGVWLYALVRSRVYYLNFLILLSLICGSQ